MPVKLPKDFYTRDVLIVAPEIIGKTLVIKSGVNSYSRYIITEGEAYRGEEDKACHASKGRTKRTEVMYHEGGKIYVYFVYGMYWMLNIVTGKGEDPQAVLIGGTEEYNGPGILARELGINRSFYGEDLTTSERIWIEENDTVLKVYTGKRIGVDYAGDEWKNKPWRFFAIIA
jgi:DNA-3-methyladenine glycosylase